MSRISLVEQYNNKDVITQVYDIKDTLQDSLDRLDEALDIATDATESADAAAAAATNAINLINQLEPRTSTLEGYVGSPSDSASATGSLYAREKNTASVAETNTANINELTTRMTTAEGSIEGIQTTIQALPTTYQARSQKDQLNGYPGLSSAGKIATSQLDVGSALNQILQAGAQLNPGEVLYVGPNGTIRSRIIGEGVEYVGNYASLAALQAYPSPINGDFATVYGDGTNDGFYMYDGTTWNMVLLFDATDYELIANKVTGISSASTNAQYPSAKAVYDYNLASDVANMTMTQTVASGGVTVSAALQNINGTQIAGTSVVIPTTNTPTASSNTPITSGGVKDAIDTSTASMTALISAKQDAITATTVTLVASNWYNDEQTVTGITGVTATNNIIITPAPASMDDYSAGGVKCTAQGSGSLTFTCKSAPENNITVNVLVIA